MSTSNPRSLTVGQNLTVYDVDDDRVLLVDDQGNKYEVPLDVPEWHQQHLAAYINGLYAADCVHVRRGYPIRDTTPTVVALHLTEEVVELAEACLVDGTRDAIVEEAGDVLALYMHLLRKFEIDAAEVIRRALGKLAKIWTTDRGQVTATGKGFSRRNRGEQPV